MSKLIVRSFSVSLDGYGAGPDQRLDQPLGAGGTAVHEWLFATRTFSDMVGRQDGELGIDNDYAARGFQNVGAWILGRNMFGPIRGPWLDEEWKGWWGNNPPYHVPVFVLTHHARTALAMEGGTTFHFVTSGIHDALEQARSAAGDRDVRIGGGVATIRQYLLEQLVDELHLAYAPCFLGSGESLLQGIDLHSLGYSIRAHRSTPRAMHVEIARQSSFEKP